METNSFAEILTAASLGIFIMWVITSAIVGFIGMNRSIGYFYTFLASLLLSPFIGAAIALSSRHNDDIVFQEKVNEFMKNVSKE